MIAALSKAAFFFMRQRKSRLRLRVTVAVAILSAGVAFGCFGICYGVAGHAVEELDIRAAREAAERALLLLEREVAALDDFAWDWASWDDTYAFLETRSREYVASNLVDNTGGWKSFPAGTN